MLIPERQQAILDFLKEHHAASVNQLSRMLFVSETSIRRDLTRLEKAGLVQKTYGGAILVQGENEVLALNARLEANKEAKILIARKAAAMVTNGSVVFLDSSSTALCMVPFLGRLQSLSVITNGARLAVAFAEYPHVRVYCSGGLLAAHIYSFNGAIAQQALRSMQADMAFVSVKALDPQTGAFCVSEEGGADSAHHAGQQPPPRAALQREEAGERLHVPAVRSGRDRMRRDGQGAGGFDAGSVRGEGRPRALAARTVHEGDCPPNPPSTVIPCWASFLTGTFCGLLCVQHVFLIVIHVILKVFLIAKLIQFFVVLVHLLFRNRPGAGYKLRRLRFHVGIDDAAPGLQCGC